MESSKDHPPLETWQTPPPKQTYVLQADKPFTHSIQSVRETPLTPPSPNN
jgi:hypothetical protein